MALSQSGIINLLIKYAWQSIEYFDSTGHVNLTGNYSMVKTYNPPTWSIDPIDKIAYKVSSLFMEESCTSFEYMWILSDFLLYVKS